MSYLGQGLGLGREERFTATATAGQTTVTTGNDGRSIAYTPNYVDVYLNGSKQVNGSDVTVTNGTSIVFASALTAGDVVDVVAPGYFQPADTVSRSLGGTFLGAVNFPSGGLNVGSGQLKVDSSGRITMPNQPAFEAYGSGAAVNAGAYTTYSYSTVYLNVGSNFNSSTGTFTAPVTGLYRFHGRVEFSGSPGSSFGSAYLYKNGSEIAQFLEYGNYYSGPNFEFLVSMAANDTINLRSYGNNSISGTTYSHRFGGILVG